jgi:hypothetical protein
MEEPKPVGEHAMATPNTARSDLAQFRNDYRRAAVPYWYRGWFHYGIEFVGVLGTMAMALTHLQAPVATDLLAIPVFWVLSNLTEYLAHRFPLHLNRCWSRTAFREHTVLHHRYFPHTQIEIEDPRDYHRVLFPWFGTFFFIFAVGGPLFFVAQQVSSNFAILAFCTSIFGFLFYETVHLCCHLPDRSRVFAVPLVGRLLSWQKEFHRKHHDPRLMSAYNFNITVPLSDWIWGTIKK